MLFRSERGFTLIEILVVIIILGILASLAIVAYGGLTESVDQSEVKSNMRSLLTELEVEKGESGGYPDLDEEDPDDFSSAAWERLVGGEGIEDFEYSVFNDSSSFEAVATIEPEDNGGGIYIVITPGRLQETEEAP